MSEQLVLDLYIRDTVYTMNFLNKAQGRTFCRNNFMTTFIEHLHTAILLKNK